MIYKAKEMTVNGEKAFYLVKGNKYYPSYKFSTLLEAEACALKENMYFHHNKAKKYFDALCKLDPKKYGDDTNVSEYSMADLLC